MFKVRKIIYFLHFSQTQVSHLQSAPQLLQLHPSPQEFWVSEKDKKKIGNEYVRYLLWPQRPDREKNIYINKIDHNFFIFKKSIEGSRIYNYDMMADLHQDINKTCGMKMLGHTASWIQIVGWKYSDTLRHELNL